MRTFQAAILQRLWLSDCLLLTFLVLIRALRKLHYNRVALIVYGCTCRGPLINHRMRGFSAMLSSASDSPGLVHLSLSLPLRRTEMEV